MSSGSIHSRLSDPFRQSQAHTFPSQPRWSPDQKRLTSLSTINPGSDCPDYASVPSIGFRAKKNQRPTSQEGSLRDSFVSFDDGTGAPYAYGPVSGPRAPNSHVPPAGFGYGFGETTEDLLWKEENKEPDDFLHDPDPALDSLADRRIILWSGRGWANVASLAVLIGGLIALFALYPIITYVVRSHPGIIGWNLGGINGTGQVPDIPGLPGLIDATTPESAMTRTGFDGQKYNLVFSDEFNTDGRTFWPGDDPFWEAVDLHYWSTTNFEWYDPDAVTTKDGNLLIQLTQEPIHNLNIRSGMIQSWNKFCFTEGYIEVNISLPGNPGVQGLWPGAWTMGNLARAGFGASNEGMWPYSYDACDVGTLPNQTNPDGRTPTAAKTTGSHDYGGELSWAPGQRTSACTCKGEDHPGPKETVGRSGPEIDILEAQYGYGPAGNIGSVSQSVQIAPMDAAYAWVNDSSGMHITHPVNSTALLAGTVINTWHGSVWQESLSGITMTDGTSYEGKGYQTFGFEYVKGYHDDGGRVTWAYNGQETWSIYAQAIGANADTEISARPVSMEPMYVILNLGISNKFQIIEWEKLKFPATMYVDYVRIYQKDGHTNIGCSPKNMPTEDYINRHLGAYTNPNFTTWKEAGYTFPKNKLKDTC
ncbi:hypothetical protein CROQUDRAFT_43782 [Cronartium quercuum f. sp. fusiforme G11]|uniref:GH16 domain-containing protein n=1 Tax=Cronartium quercuum f. sp. fusiforme G11 TaxID=708437 RepID=A0A9P6TCM8_9BASI|nr:hypothetical protein CROQUDRAFT_43782 [Cronartium quercuum f. sp. fusiforme G11]